MSIGGYTQYTGRCDSNSNELDISPFVFLVSSTDTASQHAFVDTYCWDDLHIDPDHHSSGKPVCDSLHYYNLEWNPDITNSCRNLNMTNEFEVSDFSNQAYNPELMMNEFEDSNFS